MFFFFLCQNSVWCAIIALLGFIYCVDHSFGRKLSNMATDSNNNNSPVSPSESESSWKLPDGIEDHLEAGLFKAVAGGVVGGMLGMLLFKSGKGWRSASVASGLGVAVGSTYARSVGTPATPVTLSQQPTIQTFKTAPPPVPTRKESIMKPK